MLTPSPIKRYNVDPSHPHYVPELEGKMARGDIVVTVNDKPVEGVLGFSVPDGYVKRIATTADLNRIAKTEQGELTYSRVCRDGVRVKGVVRVFVKA